jgi:hypothetical protein
MPGTVEIFSGDEAAAAGFQPHPVASSRRYEVAQSTAVRFRGDVMYCPTIDKFVKPV